MFLNKSLHKDWISIKSCKTKTNNTEKLALIFQHLKLDKKQKVYQL